jgi:flagellar motor switch protein FliG
MADLTGEEKAAFLLLSLDPKLVQAVLGQLAPDQKARLTALMDRLGASPERQQQTARILREADELLQQPRLRLVSPPEGQAAVPSASGPGPAAVGSRLNLVTPDMDAEAKTAEAAPDETDAVAELGRLEPERLSQALEGESTRTITLMLSQLDVERAGEVLKLLSPALRRDISVQMALCTVPGAEVLQRTARALLDKARSLRSQPQETGGSGRFKKTAELLRQLERNERAEAMNALHERDPDAAAQVKEFLYEFDDLLVLDNRSVQKVLAELDAKTLAAALKGTDEELRTKVMDNMSKRAREGLAEELELSGSVPSNVIRQAQKAAVEILQKLDQAGELVMLR